MQSTVTFTANPIIGKIEDFGEKIGGAKKDRAARYKESLDAITEGTLLSQPLAKVFPRPDLVKMVQEELICQEKAIILQYWWESVGQKPRNSYDLKKWVENTMITIGRFVLMLSPDIDINDYDFSENEELQLYRKAMINNGFPQQEFMFSPYSIEKNKYWEVLK